MPTSKLPPSDLTTGGATMSSLEIAEITGKRHDNVMRDIKSMLADLEIPVLSFEDTHRNPQNGQSYPIFRLPRRECLILTSGYDVALRARVIDRWELLEREKLTAAVPAKPATVAREARLTFSHMLRLGKMMGLKGNQAILSANRGTREIVGVDVMGALGVSHLTADTNDAADNVSTLAQLAGLTVPQANPTLLRLGFQTSFRDHKNRIVYEPTKKGEQHGGHLADTGKKHSNGTPVKQLMWTTATVKVLQSELLAERA